MARVFTILFGGLLVLLFASGLWLRTTSLEHLPEVNGDEVWHALQLKRMMRGEPYALFTETDLPLSPIHAALELPWLIAFKDPSLWVVRMPSVTTGILAVVLAYLLGRRMFDQTTALIAAGLLAATPLAVIYSRTSYESSHAPLYGILMIYFAHRLNTFAVMVMLALAYFVHPTNIFLLPVLVGVIAARTWQQDAEAGISARTWTRLAVRVGALSAVAAAVGIFTMSRQMTQQLGQHYDIGLRGRHDFSEFWGNFELLVLGIKFETNPVRPWVFWGVILLVLDFGLRRLARSCQWDRLALVIGTIGSALILFIVAGSKIIGPGFTRYGLFLLTPVVLSLACLTRATLVDAIPGTKLILRRAQLAGLLAGGWALLLGIDLTHMTRISVMIDYHQDRTESPLTFRSEYRPPWKTATRLVADELRRTRQRQQQLARAPRPTTRVLTELWWDYGPMEWMALPRREIRIENIHHLEGTHDGKIKLMRESIARGDYILTVPNSELGGLIGEAFAPGTIQTTVIKDEFGRPYIHVHRSGRPAGGLAPKSAVAERQGSSVRR